MSEYRKVSQGCMKDHVVFRALIVLAMVKYVLDSVLDLDGSLLAWVGVVSSSLVAVYLPVLAWRYSRPAAPRVLDATSKNSGPTE